MCAVEFLCLHRTQNHLQFLRQFAKIMSIEYQIRLSKDKTAKSDLHRERAVSVQGATYPPESHRLASRFAETTVGKYGSGPLSCRAV